ncbi:DUF3040 domain-containing protein [Streptomyces sp. UG1]|uniref:DUF3040 domain-containing protein n=1 Tax=Streptomyces sp. UG1 TaxID=3417652 RepID=UPI003CF7FAE6
MHRRGARREARILREIEASLREDRQLAAEFDAFTIRPGGKAEHLWVFCCLGVVAGSALTVFQPALGGLMFSAVVAIAVMSRVTRGRRAWTVVWAATDYCRRRVTASPPAFVLSQDQTLREQLRVIPADPLPPKRVGSY